MSVMNPLIEWEVLRVAREMIELDARTRIVCAVTGLSETRARALYRASHGKARRSGNTSTLASSFVSTPTRSLHTSVVCGIHRWLVAFRGKGDADTLLGACRLYVRVCRCQGVDANFDINDVYQIIRLVNGGRLVMSSCERCRCDYARDPDADWHSPQRSKSRLCPACVLVVTPATRDRRSARGRGSRQSEGRSDDRREAATRAPVFRQVASSRDC